MTGATWEIVVYSITFLTVVGGLFGGLCMFVYLKPESMPDGFVRIMVAIMASNMLTQLLAAYLTKSSTPGEMWGTSFLIGFCAFPVLGAIARFFDNRKASDITDMVRDIKMPSLTSEEKPERVSRAFDNPDQGK